MTDIFIFNENLTSAGLLKQQYPDIDGRFDCSNTKLSSLVGSPVNVGKFFTCSSTNIASLVGSPVKVGKHFSCANTGITTLHGIGRDYLQEIDDALDINDCTNLKSQLLGIMLVKKLKRLDFNLHREVRDIFNKHISGDRDLLNCKEELMNNGFKEFARL